MSKTVDIPIWRPLLPLQSQHLGVVAPRSCQTTRDLCVQLANGMAFDGIVAVTDDQETYDVWRERGIPLFVHRYDPDDRSLSARMAQLAQAEKKLLLMVHVEDASPALTELYRWAHFSITLVDLRIEAQTPPQPAQMTRWFVSHLYDCWIYPFVASILHTTQHSAYEQRYILSQLTPQCFVTEDFGTFLRVEPHPRFRLPPHLLTLQRQWV